MVVPQNQTVPTLLGYHNDQYITMEHTRPAANKEELDMLLSHTHPSIVSVQETFLKKNKVITFKGYSC